MARGLWWSFGEPREERGELVVDFYYQIGKHVELRLPWPTKRFADAGGLTIGVGASDANGGWPHDITAKTVETGRRLYEFLGKEAQASLIRTFANRSDDSTDRILYLQFPAPTQQNAEICLTLEDLPWELLHDGEDFITWRYDVQIIRSHPIETFPTPPQTIEVSSWRILLVTPFIFADNAKTESVGLSQLPLGCEEAKTMFSLQERTHGLILVDPQRHKRNFCGVTTFREFEDCLMRSGTDRFHIIHFVGHGVIYDDEPCLCFETKDGQIDYVSVTRLRKMFMSVRDAEEENKLPPMLFLNACSSSSRGRYSAGFASGLHDLGMCVLGYHADIYDDSKLIHAADSFYQSLCIDQSLQTPHVPPNVIKASKAARKRLRNMEHSSKPAWGSLRAYIPSDISFNVRGRGMVERTTQKLYSHFAQWMNPQDYTDHLSVGFQFAILFGALMGLVNLAFIFPESVTTEHYTYQEIVSEITRVFLVGPLSFLAAALFISYQTLRNHRFLLLQTGKIPLLALIKHSLISFPIYLLAGASFGALFIYSFARLDLLTAQITPFASITDSSIETFWYSFISLIGGTVAVTLFFANWLSLRRKETLHSYRTFYWVFFVLLIMALSYSVDVIYGSTLRIYRVGGWVALILLNITAYSFAITKIMKETSWRALQKSGKITYLSWRKLLPLLGGAVFMVFCYYLLEASVSFESNIIQNALLDRKESIPNRDFDPHVKKIIERALRQRAIQEIPDSIKDVAKEDWLLSMVYADYVLYRSMSRNDRQRMKDDLMVCQTYISDSEKINPEVHFKDYFCNISAMVELMFAICDESDEIKWSHFMAALPLAEQAVEKDDRNFAYRDTLARVERSLSKISNGDLPRLQKAAAHIREAQWRAFFLRSTRAQEVRNSIDKLAEEIDKDIIKTEENNQMFTERIHP